MIRYLLDDEKEITKQLYMDSFPEDSKEFVDRFYYKTVTASNRILVYEQDREVLSMLQLNPYRTAVDGMEYMTDYIVAVATQASSRRRGYMRQLLSRMLHDMNMVGTPWTYLMPANPAYYEPFDFEYIYNQANIILRDDMELTQKEYNPSDKDKVLSWMCFYLKSRYEVYNIRDDAYVTRFLEEIGSEDGKLYLIYNDKKEMVGIRATAGIKEIKQRCLICEDEYVKHVGEDKPAIMARIVNLPEFVKAIKLSEEVVADSLSVMIHVKDDYIETNAGTWLWTINREASTLYKMDESDRTDTTPEYTIAELTKWLFGYAVIHKDGWCDKIRTLQGIYLDEVV